MVSASDPPSPNPSPNPAAPEAGTPQQAARAAQQQQLAAFQVGLRLRTPRVWATPALVAVNVAIFVAMALAGVGFVNPSVEGVLAWGANYGPLTTGGQPWRLLSYMFLHFGVVHVAMNMFALWQMGYLVERLLGHRGFLSVYFFAGVAGSLASLLWNPFAVAAGASGAVFGVYGALPAYLLRSRGSVPRPVLQALMRNTLMVVGLNVVFGLQAKGIDMAAHAGGFVGGFAATLLVATPLNVPLGAPARVREIGLLVLTAALVLVPGRLPRTPDVLAEQRAFDAVERQAIAAYNDALSPDKGLSEAEIARVIDEQVLPPWRQFADRWQSVSQTRRLPAESRKQFAKIARYLDLRGRGWALFSEALRTHDRNKMDQAATLQREAESVFKGGGAEKK